MLSGYDGVVTRLRHPPEKVEMERCSPVPSDADVADLRRSTRWAGLRPGDPVQVDGTRLRGASWEFVAHVTNGETGLRWLNRPEPNVGKARELTERVVADARRASEIIDRIRAMATGRAPQQSLLSDRKSVV